ncbi:MAG TPA: IS91 family transposase [Candidatus Limnocylindria bacterium]|nr:IS91 family transposase [Candidatus Limnocylindria bacterium]
MPRCTAVSSVRSRLELADIVRAHGDAYRRTHRLAAVQHRALDAIETCRTAALGGHQETCDHCGAVRITYNSCRNRHCPKCQMLPTARWLAARRADLLPIPYFHVVFTLPHDLNALAQGNPRVIYALLFRAAADTLLAFGRDPRHLGGTIGITAILHTWGQNLSQHLHLHCLVTGGALSSDRSRWIPGRSSFLFPVRALSTVFRAKYLAALRHAFNAGQLQFADGTATLASRSAFDGFLGTLRTVDWIVYAKRPFAGPEQVLAYLGRYTHRVALSNDRLVALDDRAVRFRWKDYADHDRVKILTLQVDEFLRRFLLHVVPRGFMRIRHFGLLANRTRRVTLARCRRLLGEPPMDDTAPESTAELIQRLTGIDLARCPVCGEGRMHVTALVVRVTFAPDTS